MTMVGGKAKAGFREARQRLAEAIAVAAEAQAVRAAEDAAVARAKDMVRAAESDLAAAVTAVAKAREALTDGMVAAAKSGGSAPSDGNLVAARRRHDQAQDVLDAAQAALAAMGRRHLIPQMAGDDYNLVEGINAVAIFHGADNHFVPRQRRPVQTRNPAEERVQAAAADVIRPLIEPTIEAAMRAHREWIEARAKLRFLHGICFPEVISTPEGRRVLDVADCDLFDVDPSSEDEERWQHAFEALKRDASAPLPWEA
ncbi:hypothetical protein ACWGS9_19900 [Bradyrhizobium sp. Arg314]